MKLFNTVGIKGIATVGFFALTMALSNETANGLTLNGAGQVTDWDNIKPFTAANGMTVVNGVSSNRENNISPIFYPHPGLDSQDSRLRSRLVGAESPGRAWG